MQYKHFDFLVEEMTEEDAEKLLDEIILKVEAKGLHMGGRFEPVCDADMEFWPVVKKHALEILEEVMAQINGWMERILG